jgi:hypothetical protein
MTDDLCLTTRCYALYAFRDLDAPLCALKQGLAKRLVESTPNPRPNPT